MKKRIGRLTAAVLALTAMLSPLPAGAEEDGVLSAHDVAEAIAVGYNLGNDLDCYTDAVLDDPALYEWAWGNAPADAQVIRDIRDAGFDAVRLPVTWGQHCDAEQHIDSAWIGRVRELVDEILANDMYCILNIHHDTNLGWLSADMEESGFERFGQLWEQIAAAFADYDERLVFEGYNEINGKDADGNTLYGFYDGDQHPDYERCISASNRLNQIFVDTVRASEGNNPERVLLCNTYAASASVGCLQGFVMPEDTVPDKLIAGVHIYEPWEFCSYDNMYVTRYEEAGYDTDLPGLERLREMWADNAEFPYPIIIGEFGTDDKNNLEARIDWTAEYLSRTQAMGVTCFVWDDGQQFQLYSRLLHAWKYPELIERIMEICGKDCVLNSVIPGDGNSPGTETDRFHIIGQSPAFGKMEALSVEDNTFTARILDGGSAAEDIHAEYHGVQLDMGTEYTVSFDAACAGIASLNAAAEIGVLRTTGVVGESFLREDFVLREEPQHFTFRFTPQSDRADSIYSFGVLYLGGGEGDYMVTVSGFTIVPAEDDPGEDDPGEDDPEVLRGDVNADGSFDVADVVLLQKWLLAVPDTQLPDPQAADLCEDGELDTFDLSLMKRALLSDAPATKWEVVDMGIMDWEFRSDTAIDVTVRETGEETWWAQVYLPCELEAGATYEIEYTIEADAEHGYNICIQKNGGDYDTYYFQELTASPEPQTIRDSFTMEDGCTNAKIGFNLGYETGVYRISEVRLVKVE